MPVLTTRLCCSQLSSPPMRNRPAPSWENTETLSLPGIDSEGTINLERNKGHNLSVSVLLTLRLASQDRKFASLGDLEGSQTVGTFAKQSASSISIGAARERSGRLSMVAYATCVYLVTTVREIWREDTIRRLNLSSLPGRQEFSNRHDHGGHAK